MEEIVPEAHPIFASWLDLQNDECMFTKDQANDWDENHLMACHWYIEIDPLETPFHEIENRRLVEPLFQRAIPLEPANVGRSTGVAIVSGRAGKSKSKGPIQKGTAPNVVAPPKELLPKAGKRTAEDAPGESSKRGKRDEPNEDREAQDDAAQSKYSSSKSLSQITRGFGGAYIPTLRRSLVQSAPRGTKYLERIINNSLEDFLASEDTEFEEFAYEVHFRLFLFLSCQTTDIFERNHVRHRTVCLCQVVH